MPEETKRACSFCGKPDTEALAMIAATKTDAVICGGCVTAASGELLELANRALHMARDASVAKKRDEHDAVICDECGNATFDLGELYAGWRTYICSDCGKPRSFAKEGDEP